MNIDEIKKDVLFIGSHTLQPSWFKVSKVLFLVGMLFVFLLVSGFKRTIIWFLIFMVLGLFVHVLYRTKTHNYTRSWMDFRVKEVEGIRVYERIGLLYYSLVTMSILLSVIIALFIN